MKTYYTKVPFQVEQNLKKFLRVCMRDSYTQGIIFSEISTTLNTSNALLETNFVIAPGNAIYFCGGRESLCSALSRTNFATARMNIKTEHQTSLRVAIQTGITFTVGSRANNFFRMLSPTISEGLREFRKELLALQHKSLTVVCVYNSDTNQRPEPDAEYVNRMIGDSIKLTEVARLIREMMAQPKVKTKLTPQEAVNNLFDDLNIS